MINCVLLNKSTFEIVYDKTFTKPNNFMPGNDFNQNFFTSIVKLLNINKIIYRFSSTNKRHGVV